MALPASSGSLAWRVVRTLARLRYFGLGSRAQPTSVIGESALFALGVFGTIALAFPWLIVRVLCAWIPRRDHLTAGLNRLVTGLPVYFVWSVVTAWALREYLKVWVVTAWLVLLPVFGLLALRRTQHFRQGRTPRRILPLWSCWTTRAAAGVFLVAVTIVVLRERPVEWLRGHAPELTDLSAAQLDERLADDERAVLAVIADDRGFTAPESYIPAGAAPDLTAGAEAALPGFLAGRTLLLRTAWRYQRHADIAAQPARLRAWLLHYTAALVAYERSAHFVAVFSDSESARQRLNTAQPDAGFPAGVYDQIRAQLSGPELRAQLAAGWRTYEHLRPEWESAGLVIGETYGKLHAAIHQAAESVGLAAEPATWRYYLASAAVTALVGDTLIAQPRHGRGLLTPELVAQVAPFLQPGDILFTRSNGYHSRGLETGYWSQVAIYTGTAEQIQAGALDLDLRTQRLHKFFEQRDAAGDLPALVEIRGEGVVLSSLTQALADADSVAVLRPRLTAQQRLELIARACAEVGRGFDFDYDLAQPDRVGSGELIHRALAGLIDLPEVQRLGRAALPPTEIVRFWASGDGGPKFEFVAYLDGNPRTGKCGWASPGDLALSVHRPALTWFP